MTLLSVNVGRARPIAIGARTVTSPLDKRTVAGRISVRSLGLEGLGKVVG